MTDNQQHSGAAASNDAPMPPETSAPEQAQASESNETTDRPTTTKGDYVETTAALVDKHLLSGVPSRALRSVVVLVWFLAIVWLLIWAHYDRELSSWAHWALFGLKVLFATVVALVADFLLSKKDS